MADDGMGRHTTHYTYVCLEGAYLHTYIASEGDVRASVGLAHDSHHGYLEPHKSKECTATYIHEQTPHTTVLI